MEHKEEMATLSTIFVLVAGITFFSMYNEMLRLSIISTIGTIFITILIVTLNDYEEEEDDEIRDIQDETKYYY